MNAIAETTAVEHAAATIQNLPELLARARSEVGNAIVGHTDAVELMMLAALARGHVLLE